MTKPGLLMRLAMGLLLVTPALGRLGESVVECHKRYGRPLSLKPCGTELTGRYRKGAYEVKVVFAKNRAVEIYYSRADERPLKDRDLDLFLEVNSSTSRWNRVDQLTEWREINKGREDDEAAQAALMRDMASFFLWSREDGAAEASYDREQGMLLICDSSRLKSEDEETEDIETEELHNPLGF